MGQLTACQGADLLVGAQHIHAQPQIPVMLLQNLPHKIPQIPYLDIEAGLLEINHRAAFPGEQDIVLVKLSMTDPIQLSFHRILEPALL